MSLCQNFSFLPFRVKIGLERLEIILRNDLSQEPIKWAPVLVSNKALSLEILPSLYS